MPAINNVKFPAPFSTLVYACYISHMKQWVNMLCAVLLLFIAGSTKASSLPIMPSHTVPQQQVMLTASPSHAAQLPEVLQTLTYSPVVHRASSFLFHAPAPSPLASACRTAGYTAHLLHGSTYVPALPLHLALRVLLI